ncbi:DUF1376 domain-containing protein [Methylobacterium sp. J-043]|nr:DUF1376 domain-containing protein [Methylobacterium sp. J-043]
MSPLPTLPLLVDRFIADTTHMAVEEVGAHIRLLMFAWRSPGCCLPNNDARLARMLGLTAKRWASLKPGVMALWQLNSEGNYTHNQLTREHQFVSAKVEGKRAAGKLGGRPKSLKLQDTTKASGSEIGKQTESKSKAPTPTPTESPLPPSGGEPEGFAEFRSAYPARNATFPTTLARKRWLEALKRGTRPEEIIAGAKAYAAEQRRIGKVGTEYVKTADSWLYKQIWRDFTEAAPPKPAAQAAPPVADDTWRDRVKVWRARGGHWPWRPSAPPDDPRTLVPQHILAEFGMGPRYAGQGPASTGAGR